MLQKGIMLIATLFLMGISLQAEEMTPKVENSDTIEAIAEDAGKMAQEENVSEETDASEVITPIPEKKQKPTM